MWNKYKKYILTTILTIVFLIVIDISQALIFQKSPILKLREYINGETVYYKDNGLITYTYNCKDEETKTILKWKKYSCPLKETTYEIIDESKNIKDFVCNEELEEIYRDDEYIYFLSCMKSEYIKVNYSTNNIQENIKTALKDGRVKISDLDLFKIDYIKKEINEQQVEKENQVIDNKEEDNKEEQTKEETSKQENKTSNNKSSSNQSNNIKKEEAPSSTTKEVEQTPKEEEKTQSDINDEYRKQLESKYSVKILYKNENGSYLIGGSIGTEKIYDDNEINKYLKEINTTLGRYPSGFFKEMKNNNVGLKIFMVNKIDGGYSAMTDGRNKSNVTITMATAGTSLFEWTMHHEIMHYIDIYITQKDSSLNLAQVMKSYNPEGFSYGNTDNSYVYNFSNPNEAYFLSTYAKQNYLEDRATLFTDMMSRTLKRDYYNEGTPINKKANLINDQLHKYFNCVSRSKKEHWEKFL